MSDDKNTLTLTKLIEAKKLLDENAQEKFMEIYPLRWAKNPELKEVCDARVRAGIGVWELSPKGARRE